MKTFRQWIEEIEKSHNCPRCEGKIFCVSIDEFRIIRCNYCNKIVDYPSVTREELNSWIDEENKQIKNISNS